MENTELKACRDSISKLNSNNAKSKAMTVAYYKNIIDTMERNEISLADKIIKGEGDIFDLDCILKATVKESITITAEQNKKIRYLELPWWKKLRGSK